MSLRTRLLLAFAAVVVIPLALLAFGFRQEMIRRLSQEYQRRVDSVVEVIREDLAGESDAVAARLRSLQGALVDDNRFRVAAVADDEAEREYLLDYAGTAMRLTGLSMLQIHDADGRILSSGHFRNEHGRVEAGLAPALSRERLTLVASRSADREILALARAQQVHIGDRTFTIVGGITVDPAFLTRLARDRAIVVSLTYPGGAMASGPQDATTKADAAVGELHVPIIRSRAGEAVEVEQARLAVVQPLAPLRALVRSADAWLLSTAAGTGILAVLLGMWVSSRLSGRLSALAEKTAVLDLDRLDVDFDPGTDEVGTLSRLLGDLAARLRTSTARIRDAERRATVGDLARQVNHDIKNGLIPLRNVMRHLTEVERGEPGSLPQVFAERRQTIDSSIAYLETLATSYQRLSPPLARRPCDLNALVEEVARGARAHPHVELAIDLAPSLPTVVGDPVAFRRILENLTANAVDSLEATPGRITISTQFDRDGGRSNVRVIVADTGRGMSADEAGQIFNDFYTTKAGGTGLGLSIVRRLVMDFYGTLRVESAPGQGTRIIVEIPAGGRPAPVSSTYAN